MWYISNTHTLHVCILGGVKSKILDPKFQFCKLDVPSGSMSIYNGPYIIIELKP